MITWTYINIKGQGHSLTLVQSHSDSVFSNICFFEKPLWPIEAKFYVAPPSDGERKFDQTVYVTWPRWPPCPYMVKTWKKNIFSGTKRPMTLKVGMTHWVLKFDQICSNDNPGMTLTYFAVRSNLVPYAFVCEKGKTMNFSETVVVYDVKVGRCS